MSGPATLGQSRSEWGWLWRFPAAALQPAHQLQQPGRVCTPKLGTWSQTNRPDMSGLSMNVWRRGKIAAFHQLHSHCRTPFCSRLFLCMSPAPTEGLYSSPSVMDAPDFPSFYYLYKEVSGLNHMIFFFYNIMQTKLCILIQRLTVN